ncbi:Biotin-independent malonate decarboxylase subunit beta OS=Stutzerimonas stutzeri OX=316 GN=CXK91_18030 PE=4 SV=1 [Stutzerimonas stutzeri]
MSIAAGLCSYLVVTREARVGLNGPQVIEQEAGIEEYDSRDRPFIWSLTGGEQRHASGLVDAYVADDTDALRAELRRLFAQGKPAQPRSRRHTWFLQRLADADTRAQLDAAAVRALYQGDAQ